MTTRKIDRLLMALGALLILISSSQLFFAGIGDTSGEKLGTLASTLSVVKTKNALSLDWRDASIGNDVTENQLIYTDDASSAEVVFDEGSSLDIGENSLIKLSAKGKDQGMDLERGIVRATIRENQPLKIQMNGEDYILSGKDADIQINLQDKKGEIGVLSGEVKVEAAKVSENLTPEVALNVEGSEVSKKEISFKALTPKNNSIHYVLNDPVDMVFTWDPPVKTKVLLSRKPSLEGARTLEAESGVLIPLASGLWYYRLENEKGTSLINSFRVVEEKPPQVIRPLTGSEIVLLEDKTPEVLLQWKGEERLKYLVQWFDTETREKVVSGQRTFIEVGMMKNFRWRVKIQSEERPEAIWSEWQDVETVVIPKPHTPTDLIPHDVEYQTYQKSGEAVELSWKGNNKFEIEIKKPSGETTVLSLEENFLRFDAKESGKYEWRVRSLDEYLRMSEWSEWKNFTLQDLSGKSQSEVQRIQLKKPDQAVTFEWESTEGTTSVFELSKDPAFKEVVKKTEVKADSARVNIPETGSYYWRSRHYLPDGKLHVSEPKRVIIEPVPAPVKPEKLPDMEVPLEEFLPQTTFLQKVIDFIIPSAYADETKGMVKLALPVKEEAKAFVVRIYRDEELKELMFEKEITSKEFIWENAEEGEFYWQYAVVDYWDRRSLFSDPSKLIVKSEEVAPPEQPRLRYPIRAREVDIEDLTLNWTESKSNDRYRVEISESRDFRKILAAKETKESKASFTELKLEPKLHFWRVHAFNKKGKKTLSNTGRFVLLPSREKTIIEDHPSQVAWKKEWKSRGFMAWAPSMDSYSFQDGETGKISGTAMMGIILSGTLFRENSIWNGEVLRQTGKVFEGESYLFQRVLIDGIKLIGKNSNHKWGAGLALGQSSGMAYSITANAVGSEAVSGLAYGPVVRNYLALSDLWQLQGRLQYLLGEIKEMEFGADAIRTYKSYLLTGGVSYSSREYEVSSGKQTSIRLTLGIGKEF